ncbi:type IV secretion system DNA-binding domain-containing protein [Patescibacteria group bacterium]|nr:type IV secretion system DNA-binding domain-containing protein [Patescibacteria group bacterium]MBU1868531.1 type IV secretion system DNA-binding domain-containing protein [Patescibacteria group bacterium]
MIFYTVLGSLAVLLVGGGVVFLKRRLSPKVKEAAEMVVLLIEVPKYNEKGPVAAELMFASLHGLMKETPSVQEHLSFEIVASSEGIKFYATVPSFFVQFVKSQVYAQYPQAQISNVEDYASKKRNKKAVSATEIVLARDFFYPIKTFPNFEVDPLAAITSAAESLSEEGQAWLQILIRPVPDAWQETGYTYINAIRQGLPWKRSSLLEGLRQDVLLAFKEIAVGIISIFPEIIARFFNPSATFYDANGSAAAGGAKEKVQITAEQKLESEGIESKITKLGFEAAIRIIGVAENIDIATNQVDSLVAALEQFATSHLNSFERSGFVRAADEVIADYQHRTFPTSSDHYFVLNTEELASLFHLPNITVETPNIAWSKAKQVEFPLDLPIGIEPIIGETAFREQNLRFGIKLDDRRRHMYVVGKTGTGKTTFMEQMILSDIYNGHGLAFLDPHGDSIVRLLDYIPRERIDDVVIFDPSDLYYPVAVNMLELFDPDQKGTVASGLVDVFRRRFEFSWGPRLEHILRNCILTLLEIPHSTLLGIARLLTDRAYQKYIVHLIRDPMMKQFWEVEFDSMSQNRDLITTAIAPIQNRLGQFLSDETIRNIVSQPRSTIRLDELMDSGKILLVNLSKGKIGEDNSAILGGMLISRLWFAAMTRVHIPEEERNDFFVYADEFQNFATSAFASILSEARKYRLNLILAHQYLAQLPEEVHDAIFGNVGTMITFTVGQADAEILGKEFAPILEPSDLIGLEKHHIYTKMMIDKMQTKPFSARTILLDFPETGLREEIINRSREQYAADRNMVESRIEKWARKEFIPGSDDDVIQKLREELWSKRKVPEQVVRTNDARTKISE